MVAFKRRKLRKLRAKLHKSWAKLAKRAARKALSRRIIAALEEGVGSKEWVNTHNVGDLMAYVEAVVGTSLQHKHGKLFFYKMLRQTLQKQKRRRQCQLARKPTLVNNPSLVSE